MVREDPLGTPPSLSAKEVLREPREGPENLGRRKSWRSEIMNASNNDYWVQAGDALVPLKECVINFMLNLR